MTGNGMSLKAKLRNLAKEKNVTAQVLLQNYMFERFLDRLSQSPYRDKFVLKGGMLVAAMVGLDTRSTMDLDTTLRQLPLTESSIRDVLHTICGISLDDGVIFQIGSIAPIRPDDSYGGFRISLTAIYDKIETPLSIDVSTGDAITPEPVQYCFRGIFDDKREIVLWAYNVETVLAEKVETILRRNVFNTRPRDFYDIYILSTTQRYDLDIFKAALSATAEHRGTWEQIANFPEIYSVVQKSPELQGMWKKYQRQYPYAANVTYSQIMAVLAALLELN